MPYKISPTGKGKYKVTSPHGIKAYGTSLSNAQKQVHLLRGVEHGWKPSAKKK